MEFNENGKLVLKACKCGVVSLDEMLISTEQLKANFGNRDIVFIPVVASESCAEKYPGMKANIIRESCMYYN